MSAEEIDKISNMVQSNCSLVVASYEGRTRVITEIISKQAERTKAHLVALQPLGEDTESHVKFCSHIKDTEFNNTLEKAQRELAKLKAAVTKLGMEAGATQVAAAEKTVNQGRGLIACYAALVLLMNPKLAASGKAGDALRKQLEQVKAMMETKNKEYGGIPQWLMDRINVALGVSKPAVGDSA